MMDIAAFIYSCAEIAGTVFCGKSGSGELGSKVGIRVLGAAIFINYS